MHIIKIIILRNDTITTTVLYWLTVCHGSAHLFAFRMFFCHLFSFSLQSGVLDLCALSFLYQSWIAFCPISSHSSLALQVFPFFHVRHSSLYSQPVVSLSTCIMR